jgi:hypothetical protein
MSNKISIKFQKTGLISPNEVTQGAKCVLSLPTLKSKIKRASKLGARAKIKHDQDREIASSNESKSREGIKREREFWAVVEASFRFSQSPWKLDRFALLLYAITPKCTWLAQFATQKFNGNSANRCLLTSGD